MPILKTKSTNVIALSGCSNISSVTKLDLQSLGQMSSWSLILIYSGHTACHEWGSKGSLNDSGILFLGEQVLLTGPVCMLSSPLVQYQDFRNMLNETSHQCMHRKNAGAAQADYELSHINAMHVKLEYS
uniref:Uncharacterized protein n=1 Tax=Glossina austeni TaxID=7395 RepID=A0A1A9VD17_GLOAU